MGNVPPGPGGGVAIRPPSGDPAGPSSYRRAGSADVRSPSSSSPAGLSSAGGSGGVAGAGSDELLSSLPGDLTSSSGALVVRATGLRPGSGRRMRSYRVRFLVPGGQVGGGGSSGNAQTTAAEGGATTVEASCKCFVVSSGGAGGDAALRRALAEGDAELRRLRSLLSDPIRHPHVLPYSRWVVGPNPRPAAAADAPVSRTVYLLRSHVHSSLPDRLGTRPFLSPPERDWIAYQLLRSLRDLHAGGVVHGHLTPDNVLLTSWNWALVSDVGVSRYKPAALPDDDPGTYVHWYEGRGRDVHGDDDGEFDEEGENSGGGGTSARGRHGGKGEERCCLAPERFVSPSSGGDDAPDGETSPTPLTPAADVFGLGCVLVELYTGERAMDLGDLMEYRRSGSMPAGLVQRLGRVGSSRMRAAVRHMLSLEPGGRMGPGEYLERLSESSSKRNETGGEGGGAASKDDGGPRQSGAAPFPDCFSDTIHPFLLRLHSEIHGPDARLALVACHYGRLMREAAGVDDRWGEAYFHRLAGPELLRYELPDGGHDEEGKALEEERKSEEKQEGMGLEGMSLDDLMRETEVLLSQLGSGGPDVGGVEPPDDRAGHQKQSQNARAPPPRDGGVDPSTAAKALTHPGRAVTSMMLQVVLSSADHVSRVTSRVVALRLSEFFVFFFSTNGLYVEFH